MHDWEWGYSHQLLWMTDDIYMHYRIIAEYIIILYFCPDLCTTLITSKVTCHHSVLNTSFAVACSACGHSIVCSDYTRCLRDTDSQVSTLAAEWAYVSETADVTHVDFYFDFLLICYWVVEMKNMWASSLYRTCVPNFRFGHFVVSEYSHAQQ